MKPTFNAAAAVAATFAISAHAASSIPTCGENNPCPSDTPCCSQYGQCGVGAYCLGGCDPRYSFDLQSCVAAPVCKSGDYKLSSLDDISPNTEYLGDNSKYNWVSSGTPVTYNGNSILLTMAPNTVGTLLMSRHYVWYGQISATMTTSQGAGVVTAFIMMSDVHDEIDFEFVGSDLEHAQSNFYFQGLREYGNEQNLTVSNTVENTHTYTLDWRPDSITWLIDGQSMRTKYRNETYNATTQQYHFPQSPSRVQLSPWPAGLPSNDEGTINWAGGIVDWDSPYMQKGYYYAMVNEVKVDCYDPPDGFSKNHGSKAYYYDSTYGTNDTVAIGNNNTELASFYATGDDPEKDPNASASPKASSTKTQSSASMTATPETVPGISGGGAQGIGPAGRSSGNSGNVGNSGSDSGRDSSSPAGSQGAGMTGFQQGGGSDGASSQAPKVFAGSAVALLGFFIACLLL